VHPREYRSYSAMSISSTAASPDGVKRDSMFKSFTTFFLATVLAQIPPSPNSFTSEPPIAQQSNAAPSPAKSIGLFAYPKNQQSAEQQQKDEGECFASAKQQSGIDPQVPPAPAKTEEQKKAEQKAAADNAKQVKGGRVRGAARGAAGGAAVGAIADDEAGKGAAAGATVGTMAGGAKQRQANKASKQQAAQATAQKQQQEEAQAKANYQQGVDTFKRAFSACMDARGYSIK
jgi:YMGG-like Gly-zipper